MIKKRGIDISYHQGVVDFKQVKDFGVEFLILRSSYRNTADKKFLEYVKKAKEAGIPIMGTYHFSYALNKDEARQEAEFAVKQAEKAGLGKDTFIFFDFEYDTVLKAKNKGIMLTPQDCRDHTKIFCSRVEELGYQTGVYTNKDYYKNWYNPSFLSSYCVWLADYTGEADYPCLLQQYSSTGKVPGIKGDVDLDYWFYDERSDSKPNTSENIIINESPKKTRDKVVSLAQSWLGKNEKDGSYKEIIDIYNSYDGKLPRGVKMQYDWSWCACTWSALAIKLGYTDIMPIEISCGELIKQAQKMGVWVEDDSYIPSPGDAVLYDWDDNGVGDNTGWPDHVGVVERVSSFDLTVIEGNKSDAVDRRNIALNSKFIRGFITPLYDGKGKYPEPVDKLTKPSKSVTEIAKEVIDGRWDKGENRKKLLEQCGYNYREVQDEVNRILKTITPVGHKQYTVTAFSLRIRKGPGTRYETFGYLSMGQIITCNGKTEIVGDTEWIGFDFKDTTGWCSTKFLKEI